MLIFSKSITEQLNLKYSVNFLPMILFFAQKKSRFEVIKTGFYIKIENTMPT